MKSSLYLFAIVVYLCSALYQNELLNWIVSILSLLIVITAFQSVKRFVQGIGSAFLIIGITLLIVYGAPWTEFLLGFGAMLNILSLFALIPLIAIPIELGQYASRLQIMIQGRVKHPGLLYSITSFLSYILSSFMNSLGTKPAWL